MLPKAGNSAGASSLAQLPDGRIAAAWLANSGDDGRSAAIWFSRLGKNGWSKPVPIANRESTASGIFANVGQLSGPVLYAEGSWLHLWYASTTLGDNGGSAINHSVSTDAGESWMKPTRLQTSPFANNSTHIQSPPVPLRDGGLGLPIYHDFIARHGEWLRLSATGQILDKVRMINDVPTLQPSVIALDEQRAIAALHDTGPGPGKVRIAITRDGGQRWQDEETASIPNPNTPVALIRLNSGQLLLAGNGQEGRGALSLWISADEGKSWQASRTVEAAADGGAEFSAPVLLLGRDGRIHLTYTWRREGIKHVSFTEAWLATGRQP